MELLLNTQEERCRMEVYNEYLRKIPELLKQLETVEKMYEKAVLEEQMLKEKDGDIRLSFCHEESFRCYPTFTEIFYIVAKESENEI